MSRTSTTVFQRSGAHATGVARAAAFRKAQRHSRRVRVLRIVLPGVAAFGLVVLGLLVWLDPVRLLRGLPVEFSRISLSGDKLTIEAPRLTGFTKDAKPYSLTAQSAVQDLKQPHLVELKGIVGVVELNRGECDMRATNGSYDIKAEHLRLSGGIEIRAEGGYQVSLSDAFVEVRKGQITTDNPVRAIFPDGTLEAKRLRVFEHGARIVFEGGVAMTFKMPPPAEPEAAETRR